MNAHLMKNAHRSKTPRMWILASGLILFGLLWLGVCCTTHPGSSHGKDESAVLQKALESAGPSLAVRLRRHVEKIATEIGPRSYTHLAALREAEKWIVQSLSDAGLVVRKLGFQVADQ